MNYSQSSKWLIAPLFWGFLILFACYYTNIILDEPHQVPLIITHHIYLWAILLYIPLVLTHNASIAWGLQIFLFVTLTFFSYYFKNPISLVQIPLHSAFLFVLHKAYKQHARKDYIYSTGIQNCTENINEIKATYLQNSSSHQTLRDLIHSYTTFQEVLKTFNSQLDETHIIHYLQEHARTMIKKGHTEIILLNHFAATHPYQLWVTKHKLPLFISDLQSDFRFQGSAAPNNVQSIIAAPLLHNNTVFGIFQVHSPQPGTFVMNDLRLLSILANLSSKAINNARLVQQTHELAIRDSLTNTFVRSYLIQELENLFSGFDGQGLEFSLVMIDIDFFKQYNDQYGHIAGDKVLVTLAEQLREMLPFNALISRYGGEEFLVYLPKTSAQEAFSIIEAIRIHVAQTPLTLRQKETTFTISSGITYYSASNPLPQSPLDLIHTLIHNADQALYQAKHKGRNQTCLHSS